MTDKISSHLKGTLDLTQTERITKGECCLQIYCTQQILCIFTIYNIDLGIFTYIDTIFLTGRLASLYGAGHDDPPGHGGVPPVSDHHPWLPALSHAAEIHVQERLALSRHVTLVTHLTQTEATLCPHLVISTISSMSGSRPRLSREKISFPLISISKESE